MTKSANDNMASLHLIRNEASNWGNWVVTYSCIQTVWTSQWHGRRLARMWRLVWVVLHCTLFFCLGLRGEGATAPPLKWRPWLYHLTINMYLSLHDNEWLLLSLKEFWKLTRCRWPLGPCSIAQPVLWVSHSGTCCRHRTASMQWTSTW